MLGNRLKAIRVHQKLTQVELAQKAGVSLATLQNIEAGRGNPELRTLDLLSSQLGYSIQLSARTLNQQKLAYFGVPLFVELQILGITRNRESLLETLDEVAQVLERLKAEREVLAFLGFLFAVKDHYPKIWSKVDTRLHRWLHEREALSNKTIKLRRLALASLASYL